MTFTETTQLLPLIKAITRYDRDTCALVLQRVCDLIPFITEDVDWSSKGGRDEPTACPRTVGCILWATLGMVSTVPSWSGVQVDALVGHSVVGPGRLQHPVRV